MPTTTGWRATASCIAVWYWARYRYRHDRARRRRRAARDPEFEPVATTVYSYPVTPNSAYVPLLFEDIEDRYRCVYQAAGTLAKAIDDTDAGENIIFHIHWEEFVLRDCSTEEEADEAAASFSRQIDGIGVKNATIVWTVHNELPHQIAFHRQFLALRAMLAARADAILVHNSASIEVLSAQVEVDLSRVYLLHHPSYLGRYEDEATLQAGLARPYVRRVQGFGWIRLQKGFGEMIAMLPSDFLRVRGLSIRITGDGEEAAAVRERALGRNDVEWDIRHVPGAEVPDLLRSAACVILPYERVLTSGVALLALSVGAMLVAVDIPQLRELLPLESRRFLYPRGDAAALRRILDDILSISTEDRRRIVRANLEVAREFRPQLMARRLADLYDDVTAQRRLLRASTTGSHAAETTTPF